MVFPNKRNNLKENTVKKDSEVQLYMRERRKGHTQELAAAKAGISERTARKYEKKQALPSQLKHPRPIAPVLIPSGKIGAGWWSNWSVTQPCKALPCLPC